MDESVWDIVQKALIDNGIDTYAPGQKHGDCTAPYVVLKDDGSAQIAQFSSEYQYYTLLCYVPKDAYFDLKPFVRKCEEVMARQPIFPMLMPTGMKTPSFFDDTYNAHMISVQYRNAVRNIHL